MKNAFLTSLYKITTEWNLDPDNTCKYIFLNLKFVFPLTYMGINSIKETRFPPEVPKVDLSDFGTKLIMNTVNLEEIDKL